MRHRGFTLTAMEPEGETLIQSWFVGPEPGALESALLEAIGTYGHDVELRVTCVVTTADQR